MNSGHARLSCSGAYRWTVCAASVRLSLLQPPAPSGPAAASGTLLHKGYERGLHGQPAFTAQDLEELAHYDVNAERARLILTQGLQATHRLLDTYGIEHFATEVTVNPGRRIGRTDHWGSADLIGVAPDTGTLLVADLKTGKSRVDPQDNAQLLCYGVGALELLTFTPQRVILAVIQPPLLGDRAAVWSTTLETLLQFQAYIAERAAATDDPDAPPTPDEGACQWCPARSICPAHQQKGGGL